MDIIDQLSVRAFQHAFLQHKKDSRHLTDRELQRYELILDSERFQFLLSEINSGDFEPPVPLKKTINKQGTVKKRIVYQFDDEMNLILRLIGFALYSYDGIFSNNCYAFRQNRTVSDAMHAFMNVNNLQQKYCLKIDVSNYFNSIDVSILMERLHFLKERDQRLYDLLKKLLTTNQALDGDIVVTENRGAMAGTPISPFLANVYLREVDEWFCLSEVPYFRYSDDILILADSQEELMRYQKVLITMISDSRLTLNEKKVAVSNPGEPIIFLGFSYYEGRIGLSDATMDKMKGKIKRKAHALRKWSLQKNLVPEKAAKGFIKTMNHKLFDRGDDSSFSWSRWFFPLLSDAEDLKVIDAYMQQYIRYIITGRHYKGNYKISYDEIKAWGYRSLVHEYYKEKKQ